MKIKAEVVKFLKNPPGSVGKIFLKRKLYGEYKKQAYAPNERAVEYRFLFQCLQKTAPHTVLDVGTGLTSLPHLMTTCGYIVTATDNIYDYWSDGGMFNRHFHLVDDDITKTRLTGQWDFVSCISTLEHIHKYQEAVACMFKLLKPKGYLALTFPYNEREYVPNAYDLPGSAANRSAGYICQVYSRKELDSWLRQNKGRIIDQEYWQCFEGEFWTLGNKVHPPKQVAKEAKHQLSCVLIQKD